MYSSKPRNVFVFVSAHFPPKRDQISFMEASSLLVEVDLLYLDLLKPFVASVILSHGSMHILYQTSKLIDSEEI